MFVTIGLALCLLPRTMKQFDSNFSTISIEHRTSNLVNNSQAYLLSENRTSEIIRQLERAIERAIERSSDCATERPIDRATERPSDRATERPSDRAIERPSDRRRIERPSDRAIERSHDREQVTTQAPDGLLTR